MDVWGVRARMCAGRYVGWYVVGRRERVRTAVEVEEEKTASPARPSSFTLPTLSSNHNLSSQRTTPSRLEALVVLLPIDRPAFHRRLHVPGERVLVACEQVADLWAQRVVPVMSHIVKVGEHRVETGGEVHRGAPPAAHPPVDSVLADLPSLLDGRTVHPRLAVEERRLVPVEVLM